MNIVDTTLEFVRGFILPTLLLKRKVFYPGKRARETLAEHLVQLLYFAEFFVNDRKLPYDMAKIREYILAHDMAEPATPHAKKNGFDICRFHAPSELIRRKKEIEKRALEVLRRQFPELRSLAEASARYDKQECVESRFVKAIDALVPLLNIMLDNGRTHHIDKITLQMWRKDREWRIKLDQAVQKYYEQNVLPVLIEYEQKLFSQPVQQELSLM